MQNKNEAGHEHEEIFSKVLRAGRRTYFFDVRETKAGDYYLTKTVAVKKEISRILPVLKKIKTLKKK